MADSLLDSAEETQTEETETENAEETQAQEENTEQDHGNTHSPEFEDSRKDELYAGKYKTPEDLEKGYKELSAKLREKAPEAPEKYNFDLSDDEDLKQYKALENLNLSEDPIVQAMEPVLKKHNITQEAASDLVKTYLQSELSNVPDPGEEMKKLGENGQQVLNEVKTFVGRNLSESEQEIVNRWAGDAESIKLLHKMAQMSGSKNIPSDASQATQESTHDLIERANQIKKQHGNNLYGEAAKEYERLMDAAAKKSI